MVKTQKTNHVVGDTRQHAGLKDTQDKSDSTDAVDVMDKRRANRGNAEAQRGKRNEPSRTHPLAANIGGDLVVVSYETAKTFCTTSSYILGEPTSKMM